MQTQQYLITILFSFSSHFPSNSLTETLLRHPAPPLHSVLRSSAALLVNHVQSSGGGYIPAIDLYLSRGAAVNRAFSFINWWGSAVYTCSFWEPTALTSTQLGPRQLPSVGHQSTLGFQPSPSRATRQKLLRETSEYNITILCVHFPVLRCHIQFGSFTCTVTSIN